MKVKSESEIAQLCPTPSDPWTVAHQAPPSMGFSRQEYWSGLPFRSFNGMITATEEPSADLTMQSLPENLIITLRRLKTEQRFFSKKEQHKKIVENKMLMKFPRGRKSWIKAAIKST